MLSSALKVPLTPVPCYPWGLDMNQEPSAPITSAVMILLGRGLEGLLSTTLLCPGSVLSTWCLYWIEMNSHFARTQHTLTLFRVQCLWSCTSSMNINTAVFPHVLCVHLEQHYGVKNKNTRVSHQAGLTCTCHSQIYQSFFLPLSFMSCRFCLFHV